MICPKCKTKMWSYKAGYGKAEDNIEACAIPDHYSCWCCGNYIEVLPTPMQYSEKGISTNAKAVITNPDGSKQVIGLVRELVKQEMATIEYLRKNGYKWPAVAAKLQKKHPELTFTFGALSLAYHKIKWKKTENAQVKGGRREIASHP